MQKNRVRLSSKSPRRSSKSPDARGLGKQMMINQRNRHADQRTGAATRQPHHSSPGRREDGAMPNLGMSYNMTGLAGTGGRDRQQLYDSGVMDPNQLADSNLLDGLDDIHQNKDLQKMHNSQALDSRYLQNPTQQHSSFESSPAPAQPQG